MNARAMLMQATSVESSIITLSDSYKVPHFLQYPPGTTKVYSFFESRGGRFPEVTFFGLQYILKRFLVGTIITEKKIQKAKRRFAAHFGNTELFNEEGWRDIISLYGGRAPVVIKAVPEGTVVPTGNVLMTVENSDGERFGWLTSYLETVLSQVWYPSTVATQSREMKKVVMKYLEMTGDPSLIDFKVHDFGFRGSTSVESAGIGGAAHLVSFKGTDTLAALDVAEDYYGEANAGFSIPAAEHSTITSWGRKHEADAYRNMLEKFPTGLVAVVSDSYDIYEACKKLWGCELREQVLARDGVLVVRPDSGHPPDVVVPVLGILGNSFGYEVNAKGYKVLNPKVRVIQGDGIDYEMLDKVLAAMKIAGWSADNVAFGSGGGLLQKVDRDTQKFAFKCSWIEANGVGRDVMKDPVTDPGKRSKAGRLALVKVEGVFRTMREDEAKHLGLKDELVEVFRDGELIMDQDFASIRVRAAL